MAFKREWYMIAVTVTIIVTSHSLDCTLIDKVGLHLCPPQPPSAPLLSVPLSVVLRGVV